MDKETKKEDIYRASLTAFSENGFRKTTIEEIADSTGIAVGTIYLYAKNKRDLYLNSVAWGMNTWQQRVKNAVAEADQHGPLVKLQALSFTAYRYLSDNYTLRKILEMDPELLTIFESRDPYIDINRESVTMLKDILTEGVQTGLFEIEDIDETAKCLFFIYIMFVQKTYMGAEGDAVKGMFNTINNLMIRGLMKNR